MPDSTKFTLINSYFVQEYNMQVNEYIHIQTGARVVDLQNDDNNKSFVISFTTPSFGHTGVAHIMEHSVLCGSRKYPVKELFGELAKGSLNTFLNAATARDHTYYPFSTTNQSDYLNLMRAYLDSALFPLISEKMFLQEGRHLEYDKESDTLSYKGVVFNEMKGVYSNPESYIEEGLMRALFPDTIYALDSGGDPAFIPELTYEQFREFHQNYYQPTNSTTVFYGNDHGEHKFELLNEYFEQFPKNDVQVLSTDYQIPLDQQKVTKSVLSLQKPFEARSQVTTYYPEKDKAAVIFAFGDSLLIDRQNFVEMEILNRLLVSKSSSPLRRALEESGLGQEFFGGEGDIDASYQIGIFHGLKGVEPEKVDQVNDLYFRTLEQIAASGFGEESLLAAMNKYEFDMAEVDFGWQVLPKALRLSEKVVDNLMFGGQTVAAVEFKIYLDKIKAKLETNPNYFAELLRLKILDNQFSTIVTFLPKPEMLEEQNKVEVEKLAKIRQNLSEEALNEIVATQETLTKWQQTPDSDEVLATIPSLQLTDLNPKIVPNKIQNFSSNLKLVDINTNGIIYTNFAYDLGKVPKNLIPLLPIFTSILGEFDTRDLSFENLQNQVDIYTGGLDFSLLVTTDLSGKLVTKLITNAKFLPQNTEKALDLVSNILRYTKLDNQSQSKFLQLVAESRSAINTSLIPSGHVSILTYLNQDLSQENHVNNQLKGYTQLKYLEALELRVKQDWPSVLSELQELQKLIFDQQNLLINVTTDKNEFENLQPFFENFATNFESRNDPDQIWDFELQPKSQDLDLPAQVGYAAQSYLLSNIKSDNLEAKPTENSLLSIGGTSVVKSYLSMDYLWNNVRIQGGAYGCFCVFNPLTHVFSFVSYRDPSGTRTLEIYDSVIKNLQEVEISADQLKKLIIGVFGEMDDYLTPEEEGYNELLKFLTQKSDAFRQEIRDQVLSVSINDFRNLSQALEQAKSTKIRGILGKK